ncbi:MAG: hypothetical protein R2754_17765 [Microthrixaceae bacterium]
MSLYLNRSEGFPAERVRLLSAVLLDELVEVGSLDPVTAFDHLGEADRTYLEARLRPGALDLDALERAEHVDELARRAFLTGDEASLDGLPAGDAVNHYQELLHVVAGEEVALQRLRPTARSAIAAAVEAQGLAAEGRRLVLPDEVVQDPSLWNLFIESARRGNIQLSDAQRRSGIRYADWVALQELAGLVADESMDRAVEVGRSLVKTTHDPAFRAEAASLTGAALRALDRSSEAYDLLETQLSGNYSQGLWLNAAILAEAAKPDAARHYWTHLAKEMVAPLSWAALLRAVEAPGASGIDQWSSDLIALASEALAVCDVDTYARLLSKARGGAPKLVTELSKRGGEFDHPRSLYLLLVKAYSARPVRSDELVGCFTSVSEERRSDAWFVRELQHLADGLIAMLLDSLADAATAAEIAAALSQGQLRAWLRPEQVYLLSCLGFGQQAGHNATTKSWRPQHEYEQRVFVPLSEFRSIHAPEAPPWMELTYEGFSRAIFASIKGRLTVVTRDGAKLERITRDELHEGSLPRLQVEAERLTDRQDLKPHLDLAQACIRNMKTLTPQDSTLNSMRISELEGLVRELERVIDDYKAWP